MKTLDIQHGIQLKSMLYLTDFSKPAKAAAESARALAKAYGAKLTVLNVYPPTVSVEGASPEWYGLQKTIDARNEENRKEVEVAFRGFKPKVIIEEGLLWPTLKATLKKEDVDLIVMGTHGRTGVSQFFLGSVAEEVLRYAECAAFMIGPRIPEGADALGEFARILYPTNFSLDAKKAAAYALSLAQEDRAHITLLHVIAERKPGELVGATELSEGDQALLRKLVPPEAENWCATDVVVECGDPGERILDVAARRRAQLIVMGIHKPHGFPGAATHLPVSVVHEVISKARCPVLSVPL